MWRWRYLKFPQLLKGVRTGNKSKLYNIIEQGEQDILHPVTSNEKASLQGSTNDVGDSSQSGLHITLQQDVYNSEWKAHVRAWNLLVEGLFYLCESHRLAFADSAINTKACKKIIASITIQPTSMACLVFAYILFLVNSFDKVKNYLNEALKIDPSCYQYANNMLLMTEGRLKAMAEESEQEVDSVGGGGDRSTSKMAKNNNNSNKNNSNVGVDTDDAKNSRIIDNLMRRSMESGIKTLTSGGGVSRDGSVATTTTTTTTTATTTSISVSLHVKYTPSQVISEEILLLIFSYLTVPELGRAGIVCKSWWRLASDFSLWKAQYLKNVFVDPEYSNADYKGMCKEMNVVRRHWRIGECVETPIHTFDDPVLCLQFDEHILLTGACDNMVNVWDFKENKLITTLREHDTPVRSLQFNNSIIASGSVNMVKVWDANSYQCVQTLSNFEGEALSLTLFRHLLACGVRDNILLWNLEGIGNDSFIDASNEITGHNGMVNWVQFNDMHSLLSAGDDRTIKLWDIHSNRAIHTMTGHRAPIQSFYSDGDFVVSGALDGSLRFHDMRSKRCLETVQASQGAITCVQFNDFQILTGHITGAITHWDVRCSRWDQEILLAHKGAVSCLSFDRTQIVSGSVDCTVRLWDFSSGFEHAAHAATGGGGDTTVRFSHFKAMKNQSKFCNII